MRLPIRHKRFLTQQAINAMRRRNVSWSGIVALLFVSYMPFNDAYALEFQCQLPNDVRYLHVDIPGNQRLCEVSVSYEQSGDRKVMWHARSDTMFCSAKAYELREKYETKWGYRCNTLPDRDGIDKLSLSQRDILDTLLKQLIKQANEADPAFSINAVKAVASTPLDGQPGKLAFQFFTTIGNYTQIVNDTGDSWQVMTTINELQDQIESQNVVDAALVHAIDDMATLEVHTYQHSNAQQFCIGSQLISLVNQNALLPRNPHRYVCKTVSGDL